MIKFNRNYSDYIDETDPNYPEGKAINATTSESYDGTPCLDEFMNDVNASHIAMYEKAYGTREGISGKADTQKSSQFADAVAKYTDDKVKAHADQRGLAQGVHGATAEATPGQIVSRDEYGCAEFAPPLKSSDAARKAEIEELRKALNERILVGELKIYAGVIDDTHPVPTGWLLCDDTYYSANNYPRLWAVLPDSVKDLKNRTFKVDMRDRVPQGANDNLGEYKEAGLPNITASTIHSGTAGVYDNASGAFVPQNYNRRGALAASGSYDLYKNISFNAAKGETKTDGTLRNDVYGKSDTVQQAALCLNYIIKY